MKFVFFFMFVLVVSLLFLSYTRAFYNGNNKSSRNIEELAHQILAKSSRSIKKKYSITSFGFGVSMPGGDVKSLSLSFITETFKTKEELRRLIVLIAQEMLYAYNETPSFHQYVNPPPFTIKNINVIIFNQHADHSSVYDPNIAVANLSLDDQVFSC